MENKIILIDTDFAWEYLSGNEQALEFMVSEKSNVNAISAITTAELIKGCGNKVKLAKLYRVIKEFLILHIDIETSTTGIELIKTSPEPQYWY